MKAEDLKTLLSNQAGITALVGTRIYPMMVPVEVFDSATERPCLVYNTASVARSATFCGTIDLRQDTINIEVYARTYDLCRMLAEAVESIVDFTGMVGSTKVSTVRLVSEADLLDTEPGLFRRSLTFIIWHRSL